MTQLDVPTIGRSTFILMSYRLHSLYQNEIYTVWLKHQTLKISMILCLYVTFFVIYKRANLTYWSTIVISNELSYDTTY